MALGSNSITPRLANAEMGYPVGSSPYNDLQVDQVCGASGQNQFSFYGPWHILPDANKSAYINYQANNYRIGDFRGYNHSAATPKPTSTLNLTYNPGETTFDSVIPAYIYEMNVLDALSGYSSSALRLCYKFYSNSARTSLVTTKYATISWSNVSMPGHIRTATQQAGSTQTPNITGITTNYSTLYGDCYISDVSGTRLLNLGTAVSSGYFQINLTELAQPQINASGSVPSGSGLTGAHTAVAGVSTKCSEAAVQMTYGNNSFSFYLRVLGYISGLNIISASSVTVQLIHYNSLGQIRETKTVATGTSLYNYAGRQFSGTLTNNWAYGDYGIVNVTTCTWGTTSVC